MDSSNTKNSIISCIYIIVSRGAYLAATAITAAIPTIFSIVEEVNKIVSNAKPKKDHRELSTQQVQQLQAKMRETKEKLDSLKVGLLEVGNQILNYKTLYSATVESDTICDAMVTTLGYSATGKKPVNVGRILPNLKNNLDKSLGTLRPCIDHKTLTKADFNDLSQRLISLTREQGDVQTAIDKSDYTRARASLKLLAEDLQYVEKAASNSMYGVIKTVVDELEKKS
jgi:hypothetical protein